MSTRTEADLALIPQSPSEVAKAIVYIALAAVGILITALADDHLSAVELIQVGIVVAGAIPVYLVAGTIPKTIAAFVMAGGQAVLLLVADGTGWADVGLGSWLGVVVAAFAAIGVAVVPNGSKPGPIAVVQAVTPSQARLVQDVIDIEAATDDGTIA